MNTHEFDDIIKQKAQQREADVPEDLWAGIKAERKRRKFPFFWFTFIVLFLGAAAVIWSMNTKDKDVELVRTKKANGKNNPGEINEMDKNVAINNVAPSVNSVVKDDKAAETVGKEKLPEENNTDSKKDGGKIMSDKTTIASSKDAGRKNNDRGIISTNANKKIITADGSQASISTSENDIALMKPARPGQKETGLIAPGTKKKEVNDHEVHNSSEETALLSSKKKRNIKGNIKLNITAGQSDSSTAIVKNKEKIFSTDNQENDKGNKKINTADGEINNLVMDIIKSDADKIVQAKKEQFSLTATGDSLLTKKIIKLVDDSTDNKTPIAIHSLKPSKKSSRNTGLKIEAGLTIVSPIQNYQQPLYVKRVIDRTNIHSEFISDKIKTTIEPGAGLNISLVKSLNKKWSVGIGIAYLRFTEHLQMTGIETHTNYTIIQRVVNAPGGSFLKNDTVSAVTKDKTTLNGRNIYSNFSMPLFIRYQVTNTKKWAVAITSGAYIDLVRKYDNSTPGKFETIYAYGSESAELKNTIGIDLFAGLHLERRLSKKYALFAAPEFRYNLSSYKNNNLSFNKKIHKPTVSIGITRYL